MEKDIRHTYSPLERYWQAKQLLKSGTVLHRQFQQDPNGPRHTDAGATPLNEHLDNPEHLSRNPLLDRNFRLLRVEIGSRADFEDESQVYIKQDDQVLLNPDKVLDWGEHQTLLDFAMTLYDRISPLDELVNPSLNKIFPHGFNTHDFKQHVASVLAGAMSLANRMNLSDFEKKNLIVTVLLHDLGNIYGRKHHAPISALMSSLLIPELRYSETEFAFRSEGQSLEEARLLRIKSGNTIRRGILLHDESSAVHAINTTDISQEQLKRRFGTTSWLTIVADKANAVWYKRVPTVADSPEALSDGNTLLSAMVAEREGDPDWMYDTDQNHIYRELRVTFDQSETMIWMNRSSNKGTKRTVPNPVRVAHKEEGVPYFGSWLSEYFNKMYTRLYLEITGLRIISPGSSFELDIINQDKELGEPIRFALRAGESWNSQKEHLGARLHEYVDDIQRKLKDLIKKVAEDIRSTPAGTTIEIMHTATLLNGWELDVLVQFMSENEESEAQFRKIFCNGGHKD